MSLSPHTLSLSDVWLSEPTLMCLINHSKRLHFGSKNLFVTYSSFLLWLNVNFILLLLNVGATGLLFLHFLSKFWLYFISFMVFWSEGTQSGGDTSLSEVTLVWIVPSILFQCVVIHFYSSISFSKNTVMAQQVPFSLLSHTHAIHS